MANNKLLFACSTSALDWFQERGFSEVSWCPGSSFLLTVAASVVCSFDRFLHRIVARRWPRAPWCFPHRFSLCLFRRGQGGPEDLPPERQAIYDSERGSKVFLHPLADDRAILEEELLLGL